MGDDYSGEAGWDMFVNEVNDAMEQNEAVQEELKEPWNEDNIFVQFYLQTKPRGTHESWNEDIGVPPWVLNELWEEISVGELRYRRKHLLWLMSWLRKHNSFRSMAAEWNTSKSTFERMVKQLLGHCVQNLGLVCLYRIANDF